MKWDPLIIAHILVHILTERQDQLILKYYKRN